MMKVWVYCNVGWMPEIGTDQWKSEGLNSNMVHEKSGDKSRDIVDSFND